MIYELKEQSLPVFVDIEKEIQANPFSEINLSIVTHRGQPVGLVINSFRHERFTEGQTAQAIERTVTVIKKMVESHETGTLSFTMTFNDGQVKELVHQYYDKKSYAEPVANKLQ